MFPGGYRKISVAWKGLKQTLQSKTQMQSTLQYMYKFDNFIILIFYKLFKVDIFSLQKMNRYPEAKLSKKNYTRRSQNL